MKLSKQQQYTEMTSIIEFTGPKNGYRCGYCGSPDSKNSVGELKMLKAFIEPCPSFAGLGLLLAFCICVSVYESL